MTTIPTLYQRIARAVAEPCLDIPLEALTLIIIESQAATQRILDARHYERLIEQADLSEGD